VSWLAVSPAVMRWLWATGVEWAAAAGTVLRNISFALGSEHPVYTACDERPAHSWPPYAWYLRLPDLPGFLRRVAPVLEQRLARSIAAGHTAELNLSFYRDGLRLVLTNGQLTTIEPWQPSAGDDGAAAFPGLTFLQLLFGHRSLDELRQAFPDCRVQGDEARVLLNALFPKQASSVWPIS